MGVLGDNVRTLKDKMPGKKLTLGSTLSIFYQMVILGTILNIE
jgi:serine/threonine protein kinase